MNEEIYEGTPAKEDVLIGTDSGYNRYRRPDGSTYIHYPYSLMATVTAYSAKDGKGQPIRTADGKLITGKTQTDADRNRFRYDMNHWVEANRRKTAHLPQDWRSKYGAVEGKDILTTTPIAGDILDLGHVYTDFNKGNYGMAAAGLGLFFLPNIVEKPLKWIGKPIIKSIKNRRAAKAFSEAVDESVIPEYNFNPYSDRPANYVLSVPLTEDVGRTSLKLLERPSKSTEVVYQSTSPWSTSIPTNYVASFDVQGMAEKAFQDVIDYYKSDKKRLLIQKTMEWDKKALDEYYKELEDILGTIKIKDTELIVEPDYKQASIRIDFDNSTEKIIDQVLRVNKNSSGNADEQLLIKNIIHELGGHGRTGGVSKDFLSTSYPRTAELIAKNKELADKLLEFNDTDGRLMLLLKSKKPLEAAKHATKLILKAANVPNEVARANASKYIANSEKFYDYLVSELEITARGIEEQLYKYLYPKNPIQNNGLQQFFTDKSIDKFRKAVLGVSPAVIGVSSLQKNNNKNKEEN